MNFLNQRIAEAYDRVLRGDRDVGPTMDFQPLTEASLAHVLKKEADGYFIISACRHDWVDFELEKYGGADTEEFYSSVPSERRKAFLDPQYWNNLKTKELATDLKRLGYGYVPVYGGWRERSDEHPDGVTVMEQSFFVPVQKVDGDMDRFNAIMKDIVDLGIKYRQEAVAICPPNGVPYYYVTNAKAAGEPVGTIRNWFGKGYVLNDVLQDFFTSLNKVNDQRSDFNRGTAKRFTFKDKPATGASGTAGEPGEADESTGGWKFFLNPEPGDYAGGHARYMRGEINGSRYPGGKMATF